MPDIPALIGIQLAALALVLFGRGWKACLIYLVCIPLLWFLALELVSGHIVSAIHLLWLAPALAAIWAIPGKWLGARGKPSSTP